jgi:2-polyprenyl-3-methyl-5-hydroxy-6-metoxy-1,4-benzoquinol methylase
MKKSSALAYVGHNAKGDREANDFYPTPESATLALLEKQTFEGDIWECACGDGAISKVLLNKGYKVYSSDLIDRGYGSSK